MTANEVFLITEAFHSGIFLLEEIVERGLLKKDVAKELEILPHHLSEIFDGKRNISAKLAVKLEMKYHLALLYSEPHDASFITHTLFCLFNLWWQSVTKL